MLRSDGFLPNCRCKDKDQEVTALNVHFGSGAAIAPAPRTVRYAPRADMAAGVTDELMDIGHIVGLIDQAEEAPGKCRPYRKQTAV
jgi:hypothetical protein